ncbi:hypothetical protein HZH66_009622 [Vespula vulgaris]|uniref:Uncharacterized protein n=1 Tax=Vespula vulgaris TaxID=7454 RepID=A0A834MZR2_VESVU|nr:hypothetical protein HZH66_009622 [Vespula vulgaris]
MHKEREKEKNRRKTEKDRGRSRENRGTQEIPARRKGGASEKKRDAKIRRMSHAEDKGRKNTPISSMVSIDSPYRIAFTFDPERINSEKCGFVREPLTSPATSPTSFANSWRLRPRSSPEVGIPGP